MTTMHNSNLTLSILLIALAICISGRSHSQTIDAKDFGLEQISTGGDCMPAFRRALQACREQGARELVIPPGTWHVYPDYGFEKTLAVANNNPGVKRIAFLLDGLEGFRLTGRNAEIICHGTLIPISADDASHLTISGLTIDWARPFNFQAEVIAIHPDQKAFDLRVHDEVVYELRGTRLVFREKPSVSPTAWKEWAPPTTELESWEHNLQWNMWFDGQTNHPIPGEHQWALQPDPRVQEVGPRTIRLFDAVHIMPKVGWVVAVKGMMQPNRTSPAIRIARSSNVTIEDVTIHHAGGMGVIMQRCENVAVDGLQVTLPQDKGRLVTTTADATHFNGCRGDITLQNCTFENMLDDATNVHGCFVRIEETVSPKTLVCRRVHSQQRGLVVAEVGDHVRLIRSDDLQPYAEAKVVSTTDINSDLFEVTLDRLPEEGIRPGSGLYNVTWQPNVTIRNCTVRNNRARTMLLATAGDVLVADCLFEHSSMAGIQFEGDNGFWWESGPVQNVLIRKNHFRNNAGAALRIWPQIDSTRFPNAMYHGGIRFEDNLIETSHRLICEGCAVDGLMFRGNTIRMTSPQPTADTRAPSFVFESGRNLRIEGNAFEGKDPLLIHAKTKSAIPTMAGNTGIAPATHDK